MLPLISHRHGHRSDEQRGVFSHTLCKCTRMAHAHLTPPLTQCCTQHTPRISFLKPLTPFKPLRYLTHTSRNGSDSDKLVRRLLHVNEVDNALHGQIAILHL